MVRKKAAMVRIGIIGCGGIVRCKHLLELEQVRRMRLVACSDIMGDRARDIARRGGASFHTDCNEELLARDDVDAVLVATPHPSHAEISIQVLKAGKHLLCQKPMTTRVEDAERLLQVARRANRVALALPYLFNPWTVKIGQLVSKGAVGKVRMVRCRISHDADHSKKVWFARKEDAHGGALFDMGVYPAALMVQLFGRVTAISGMFPESTGGVDVEQGAAMTLRFASGAIGVLATSWQEIGWKSQVEVFGTTGTLECIGWPGEPVILQAKKTRPGKLAGYRPVPLPRRIPMPTNVCQHWADCILKGAEPLIPVSRGVHLVEILCAGYKAVETGREMPVKSRP